MTVEKKEILQTTRVNIKLALKYAFYATIIFVLIANPETYIKTEALFGNMITIVSGSGTVTPYGFLLHSLLFFIIMTALLVIH
jgi:hypothetical protein